MLIDPASKVSVPFTVVMRMRSKVPERATDPPPTFVQRLPGLPTLTSPTQVLLVMFVTLMAPDKVFAALFAWTANPVDVDPPLIDEIPINA
jgi:hypothetical protein